MPFETDDAPDHDIQQLLVTARRLARRWCTSAAEAEDVAQEAVIRLWSSASPPRNAVTWLAVVTRRLCHRERIRDQTRIRAEGVFAYDCCAVAPVAADLRLDIDRLLAHLGERDRRLIAFVVEGRHTIEIATELDCPDHNVGQMVARARRRARALRDAALSENPPSTAPADGSHGTCADDPHHGGRCSTPIRKTTAKRK